MQALGIGIGLPFGGAAGASQSFLGLVASRCRVPNTFTAGNFKGMAQSGHKLMDDITQVKLVFPDFYIISSGSNASKELGTGAITTFKASVAPSVGGTFVQAAFGGASTAGVPVAVPTQASGGATTQVGFVTTDWTPCVQSKGNYIAVRCFTQNSVGILYSSSASGMQDAAHGDLYRVGASAVDCTDGTAFTTNAGTNAYFGPIAILAMTKTGNVIVVGDSIGYGYGSSTAAPTDSRVGIVCQGMPTDIAFLNLCSPGLAAQDFFTRSPSRQLMLAWGANIVSNFGANGLSEVYQNNASVEQGYIETIFAACNSWARKYQTTVTPINTPATGWPTPTGQATKPVESQIVAFNTAVLANSFAGQYGSIQTRTVLETSPGSGLWITTKTGDGVHPNQSGYDDEAGTGNVNTAVATFLYR